MTDKSKVPSREILRELLEYDETTKLLMWRERGSHLFSDGYNTAETNQKIWNSRYAGTPAYIKPNNKVCVFGYRIRVSEILAAIGYDDSVVLANKTKPRAKRNDGSLRIAPGIYWNPKRKRYRAQIYIDGKVHHLGSHVKLKDARKARSDAEQYSFDFDEFLAVG